MKLLLEMHGVKYSIESEHDDYTVNEMFEIFGGLLISAGYHPDNIKEILEEK